MALMLPHSLSANTPPSFDQISNRQLLAGELFYFDVRPQDSDGVVPSLYIANEPRGSELVDKGDGSRTFRWTPQADQTGEHRLLFIAVDGLDDSIRYSQEVFLTVILNEDSLEAPATIDTSDANDLQDVELIDTNAVQEGDDVIYTTDQGAITDPDQTTDVNTNAAQEPAQEIVQNPQANAGDTPSPIDGNYPPTIEVSSSDISDISVEGGTALSLRIEGRDHDGAVPGLVAHALPAGAAFNDNGDGSRSLDWTPDRWQLGEFEIVIVAIDAVRNDLRSQIELKITVTEPQGSSFEVQSDAALDTDQDAAVEAVVIADNDGGANNEAAVEAVAIADNDSAANNDAAAETEQSFAEQTLAQQNTTLVGQLNSSPLVTTDGSGNTAPYFDGLTNQVVALGSILRFIVAPRDVDGDVPGMFADRLPHRAALKDNFDGTRTFIWRPFPVDQGDTWITFTAIDARDNSLRTIQSMKISVEDRGGYNFEPVINGINNPVIRAGDVLQQKVQPVDPDGDAPTLTVLNPPAGSEFVDNRDGTRTLVWPTHAGHITEIGNSDQPHIVDFLAVDARDESLRDDHQLRISVVPRESRNRDGERLRVLAERRGVAVGFAAMLRSSSLADTDLYLDIARQEFNMVTPENSHKWGWIQPQQGEFNFIDADALAEFAVANGMQLHGHPLIWHRQLPGWVQAMKLEDGEDIMLSHIDALVSRYRGKVAIWDVINEALEEDGSFRDSVWYKAMGAEYIRKAFVRARALDPDAELVYNDYDVAWTGPKSDGMYRLLKTELERGTPIDGVGFQMHFWTAFDQYDDMRANLQRFADLGLDIYITEFDVAMTQNGQEELQAQVYESVMRVCLEMPACKAIQSWGFTDRYSWRYNHKPLLFTERYLAKPAYYAWQRALSQ